MLKEVELASEPLLWPMIRFDLKDLKSKEKFYDSGKQCETCFTIVPLIKFIPDMNFFPNAFNEIELTMRLM